ncbi:MAG: FAD-binding oxidoreductase [Acidobacteriota bacterium]
MPDEIGLTIDADNKPWGHRWGFADTGFVRNGDGSVELTGKRYNLCGYRMYDLLPYVDGVLGVAVDWTDPQPEIENKPVSASRRNESFCRAVQSEFAPEQWSVEDSVRLLHSHGQTTADEVYRVIYDRVERAVDAVFYCQSEKDAERIVALAREHDVCLVPFGGGTSVSCALKLPGSEERMIVSVNMRRLNRIEWIDRENLCACVQAGITGIELERRLQADGFTCGHEPDSIELSTLGGWISTNASGMKKNRYGNIEQIVEKITLITPEGCLDQIEAVPRASMGMQPQQLLFGSEGNLGLIIKAVIKIHPKPAVQKYGSLVFPSFSEGCRFLHRLSHSGFLPASIRLVDNTQFRFGQALKPSVQGWHAWADKAKKFYLFNIKGFDAEEMAAATIVMEGSREEVLFQESNIYRLAREFNGISGGAENGRRGYMLTYAIAYIRDFLANYHIIGETFETSVPWSKIEQVCRSVREKASQKHEEFKLPGKPYVSYRVTQVYHTGVCVYFMYAVYTRGIDQPHEVFGRIEHSLRKAIIRNGGSISHHHGVGKIRKDFMRDTLSPSSLELLKQIKRSSDPRNVFGIRNNVLAE